MRNRDIDTKEFVALLTRHSRRIYSFIRSLVPNQTDAEDLFQEVSTTLWEKYDTFCKGSDFRAWAFQIAHYKVLNFRRRRTRMPRLFSDDLIGKLADDRLLLDDSLECRSRALADCYQRLRLEDRELLDLRYTEAATVPNVATQTGRSIDFVYKALRRIHGELYQCIDDAIHGDEPK
ncbi:MAG: sigma-70 family RNA polymerase sigma factor [Pirellulales bacterium]|nr:sigma-70 family RNA polymerase sigma factor [Pirellulales bacterium]